MTAALPFDEFYRLQRAPVLRALSFTLHDAELAAEAVDEGFTRAVERWAEVSAMQNPAGWVYRVGLNWSLNRLRRRALELRRLLPAGPVSCDLESTVADPALAAALDRLSVEQRAVVVLRFYLDLSVDEVAAALDVAPGTVKSRLSRALRRLETMLEVTR